MAESKSADNKTISLSLRFASRKEWGRPNEARTGVVHNSATEYCPHFLSSKWPTFRVQSSYRCTSCPQRKEGILSKARSQKGSLCTSVNGSGTPVWIFRWWETLPNGTRVRRKKQVGTLEQYKNATAAEKAVRYWRLAVRTNEPGVVSAVTMKALIEHFRMKELIDTGGEGRAWSTRDRYDSCLTCWVEPRWGKSELGEIRTPAVEEWLHQLKRADGAMLAGATRAKIRNLMSVLFNHAIRWGLTDRNPISGPNRGSGVRQSSKRLRVPDILEIQEIQAIVAKLQLRERVLLCLDMATGLRRGELAGLKWEDIDFEQLVIDVHRSVVNQVVGRCKTEASTKLVPLDEHTAESLLAWYQETPYREPADWVFASDSNRAGDRRGKQPLWLSTVMRYHIQPVVRQLGITKRVSWHTFRHTFSSLLRNNGEDVKVVQELLRHASSKMTLDVYTQAATAAKRVAQRKVVEMVRSDLRTNVVAAGD